MPELQPLQDNVVVRPLEDESTTASGIIIPDTISKEKPMKGEVIAVGPGTDDKKMGVTIGDVVLFTKYAPTEVKLNGEELYVLGIDSCLAIVK